MRAENHHRTTGRGRTGRLLAAVTAAATTTVTAAAAVLTGGGAVHADEGGRTWTVQPGQSIQRAVDRAAPGDTIRLLEGVYRAAVYAGDKGLRIRGAGQGRTIVVPPKRVRPTPCWADASEASAFCWLFPDDPVEVRDLTTRGHRGNGVVAVGVDGFRVRRHTGVGHGEYGIGVFSSTDITLTDNIERGDGGVAGLYVGDTDDADARIARNRSTGWSFGAFLRDSRDGTVRHNVLRGNCIGVLSLDTGPNGEQTDPESGETFTNVAAGDWRLVDNDVVNNDRSCGADDGAPPLSGHGVVLLGSDNVLVARNRINGNNATGPSVLRPAGLTVVSSAFIGGDAPAHIDVVGNTIRRNDLDVFWDRTGRDIEFRRNDCRTSVPARLC